jgi:hypothetical protein
VIKATAAMAAPIMMLRFVFLGGSRLISTIAPAL